MLNWFDKVWIADKIYLLLMLNVLIIVVVRYHQLEANLHPLLWFIVAHLSMEFTADYLNYDTAINNVFLYHFFAPISYTIICVIFYRTFRENQLRRLILMSIFIYLLLAICYTILWEPLNQINSLAYMTEGIFVTYWCFMFFKETLKREDDFHPENDRMFWVVIGLLVYFIGNFFVVGAINYFVHENLNMLTYQVYYAGYAFNYLLYITLGIVCLLNFPVNYYD